MNLATHIANTTVPPQMVAVWWLGQMGLAIKSARHTLYIDPCLSDQISARAFPPPLHPAQIADADLLLMTHEHIDHLDMPTVRGMAAASPQMQIVTNGWCAQIIATHSEIAATRVHTPPALMAYTHDEITIIPIPSAHSAQTPTPTAHYAPQHSAAHGQRWLGFYVQLGDVALYHSGDTVIYDGYVAALRALPRVPALAVWAANGRDWPREQAGLYGNLYPREVAWLMRELAWPRAWLGHNDLLPANALSWAELAAGMEHGAPPAPAWACPRVGECVWLRAS
jgi:L-ascorbate 6-phosphate lactonase